MFERVVLIILDGLGVGELPDADKFGDEGSATLQHVLEKTSANIPALESLGIIKLTDSRWEQDERGILGFYGKMAEKSAGKDTTTGHWEIAGVIREKPPRTYPRGFPQALLTELTRRTGYEFLGNYPASGTVIIQELGREHLRTGKPIIYTSADSVLQVAAHKAVVPLEKLYFICETARQLCQGEWEVDRVIARPFEGSPEKGFIRTSERRDFSIAPPINYLDLLKEAGVPVLLIGKLEDIFAGRGFTHSIHTTSNRATLDALNGVIHSGDAGFVFANLSDFDTLYGHRNDVAGFAKALEEFDEWLAETLVDLGENTLIVITADHGNDPSTPSTDHSREYVPLLVYYRGAENASQKFLGVRESFSDLGATICENFGIKPSLAGKSFLNLLIARA